MHEQAPLATGRVTVATADLAEELVAVGVRRLYFENPAPTECVSGSGSRILSALPGAPGQGVVVSAAAGRGEVVVVGCPLWWGWIAADVSEAGGNALAWQYLITAAETAKPVR
jgi:hypothetical protein